MNKLHLGIAREIITPEIGCQLFGYTPNHFSTSVNDDLTATAFYLKQGNTAAIMVSATVCVIKESICDEIREKLEALYGVPKENVIIAATHTHSGPNLAGTPGWGDVDRNYLESIFLPKLYEAIRRAIEAPVPVTVGVAQDISLIGVNRRELTIENNIALGQNPNGCFNPNMTVIAFKNEAGEVIANMIHYGAHCTASGRNPEISRDWAGVMTDTLEEISGGMTAFFNGPEGDVGPRMANGRTTGRQTVKDALVHGGWAAQDAVRVWRKIRAYRDVTLEAAGGTIPIPLMPRMPLEEAKAQYEEFKNDTINWRGGQRRYLEKVIRSYEDGYEELDYLDVPQSIIRIGDVAFAGTPFELFSEVGIRVDNASDIPYVLSLSNSNGSRTYLATKDAIPRGGYEVTMHKQSYVQPYSDDADYAIVKGTLNNLRKVGGKV